MSNAPKPQQSGRGNHRWWRLFQFSPRGNMCMSVRTQGSPVDARDCSISGNAIAIWRTVSPETSRHVRSPATSVLFPAFAVLQPVLFLSRGMNTLPLRPRLPTTSPHLAAQTSFSPFYDEPSPTPGPPVFLQSCVPHFEDPQLLPRPKVKLHQATGHAEKL